MFVKCDYLQTYRLLLARTVLLHEKLFEMFFSKECVVVELKFKTTSDLLQEKSYPTSSSMCYGNVGLI